MINKSLLSSKSLVWATPQKFFDSLNQEFNFTLDPCASVENTKCGKFYTEIDDGLSKDWSNERVFCNPPYGRQLPKWVKKCFEERKRAESIVMLIPSRTDTRWFHDYIHGVAEIRFLKGRLKFEGANANAPFPSMLVIYKN